MKINRKGATRSVLELKRVVIKIPVFNNWTRFLRGLLANINEGQTWRWNSGKYESGNSYLLCPVLWTSWGGWILLMKKIEPVDPDWWAEQDIPMWYNHVRHFQGDDNWKNYGWYQGRLVKLDYGDLDHNWGSDFKNRQ